MDKSSTMAEETKISGSDDRGNIIERAQLSVRLCIISRISEVESDSHW